MKNLKNTHRTRQTAAACMAGALLAQLLTLPVGAGYFIPSTETPVSASPADSSPAAESAASSAETSDMQDETAAVSPDASESPAAETETEVSGEQTQTTPAEQTEAAASASPDGLPDAATVTEGVVSDTGDDAGNSSDGEHPVIADPLAGVDLTKVDSANTGGMTISQEGIDKIKGFEGFAAYAFWDSQQYSVGYGSACGSDQYIDTPITEEEAELRLTAYLVMFERSVNAFLDANNITLNQSQFDALVSFSYNVGTAWMSENCTLRSILLAGSSNYTTQEIQDAFGKWVYASGEVVPGLVTRRAAEAALFCTPTATFSDVDEDDWYNTAVLDACRAGIFTGSTNTTEFRPKEDLTRAGFVSALAKLDRADLSGEKVMLGDGDDWYGPAAQWAAERGYIVTIYGCFYPNAVISRESLCMMLQRYLLSRGVAAAYDASAAEGFADSGQLSAIATDAVAYCTTLGLVGGDSQNNFRPTDAVTRAEAAQILLKVFALVRDLA